MIHRNLKLIQIKFTLSEFLFIGTIPADTPLDEIEDIIDYEEIAIKPDDNREYFGLEIYGDSMSPDYKDNDRIIFRRAVHTVGSYSSYTLPQPLQVYR